MNKRHEPITMIEVAQHLAVRIDGFEVGKHRPNGLLAYWHQPKNRQRLASLPRPWQVELERRMWKRVEAMNQAGPY